MLVICPLDTVVVKYSYPLPLFTPLTSCFSPPPFLSPSLRSQRDVAGEKEQREQRLLELQKKLARLEGEIATAENDRKQFDADAQKTSNQQSMLRSVITLRLTVSAKYYAFEHIVCV